MAKRKYAGMPGLSVRELIASDEGSKDLHRGVASVYVKSGAIGDHPIVLHEYLATRLAHSLGIPVPFGELADLHEDQHGWATAVVGGKDQTYAPPNVSVAAIAEPHIFAGIMVFDVWLLNTDRSDENLLWTEDLGLWAIDHEQTFDGFDPRGTESLMSHADRTTNPFSYGGTAPSPAAIKPWIKLIRSHGATWSKSATDAAARRKLQSKSGLAQYEKFLSYRASHIYRLVTETFGFTPEELF
ncbi:hypothetical protein BJH93_03985 [Kocuria polaris]|nr:hypothetical protein [Kocuria polaris]